MTRSTWANLNDAQLLAQCEVDTYRASGPGGQKRNKTSSAVRIRHLPSGLLVIAEESRSQHENRARGLKRLRQAFYLKLRDAAPVAAAECAEVAAIRSASGRLTVGRRDARFWPALGVVLDVLHETSARVADAAGRLGCTTGNLIDLLREDPKVWEQTNQLRQQFGHKQLKDES